MSSEKILSEGELDALMDSVASGDLPQDSGQGGSGEYQPFDFASRDQSLVAQMPALATICEQHAQMLEDGIGELFRISATVTAAAVSMRKLEEALVSIPQPSAINILRTPPLNGRSFLVVPGELMSFCVDQYFGGYSGVPRQRHPDNPLTPTENRINEVLVKRFMDTLQEAWSKTVALNGELIGTETRPDYLDTGARDQQALTLAFQVEVSEWQSVIEWVVPYALLEPLRPKLGSQAGNNPDNQGNTDWREHICNQLPAVELELTALFATDELSIAKILGLGKGSILPLRQPSQITVCIEGEPYFVGEHGAFNGKKAVKISTVVRTLTTLQQPEAG